MPNHRRKAGIDSCSALAFAPVISNRRNISDADKPAVPEPILSPNPPESNTCHVTPSSVSYDKQTGYPPAVPLIPEVQNNERAKQRKYETAKVRNNERAKQRNTKLRKYETTKVRNNESAKPRKCETTKERNNESAKVRNNETARPRNNESAKQRKSESAKQRECETTK